MSVFEAIIFLFFIIGATGVGYIWGWYGHGIKMRDAHLKIIEEKWGPMIADGKDFDDYKMGKLDGIVQVFEWLHEEDI